MKNDIEVIEVVELEYRDGRSDKVYIASLEKRNDEYRAKFRYGRRWNAHNVYYKPDNFTTYAEASDILNEMIHKKMKKGYTRF